MREIYIYRKKWNGKKLLLEFEGIYRKATVYVNRKKAAYHEYGYTGFYVDITESVNYGADNEIKSNCSKQ